MREFTFDQKNKISNKIKEIKSGNNLDIKTNLDIINKNKIYNEFYNETNELDLLPANLQKECCWNCLKIILKEISINVYYKDNIISDKVVKY